MLAGRRPGRRWGPPTTFADGWVRKKKRCQQFSYRSTSSAGIGIFVSIVFSHSCDRSCTCGAYSFVSCFFVNYMSAFSCNI